MKISVRVITRAKKEGVLPKEDGSLVVKVSAVPADGRANQRLQKVLAEYLKVPENRVQIESGHRAKNKIINIINRNDK